MAIPSDATIASLISSSDLVAPETYVRCVLELLYKFKASRPSVRIGTTGKGPYPRFRIVAGGPDGAEAILGTFNDNGTSLPTFAQSSECWSTKAMDLEEVKGLIGAVRAMRKVRG